LLKVTGAELEAANAVIPIRQPDSSIRSVVMWINPRCEAIIPSLNTRRKPRRDIVE
jgi:hypothetical protein